MLWINTIFHIYICFSFQKKKTLSTLINYLVFEYFLNDETFYYGYFWKSTAIQVLISFSVFDVVLFIVNELFFISCLCFFPINNVIISRGKYYFSIKCQMFCKSNCIYVKFFRFSIRLIFIIIEFYCKACHSRNSRRSKIALLDYAMAIDRIFALSIKLNEILFNHFLLPVFSKNVIINL